MTPVDVDLRLAAIGDLPAVVDATAIGLAEVDRDVLMSSGTGIVDRACHIGSADLW